MKIQERVAWPPMSPLQVAAGSGGGVGWGTLQPLSVQEAATAVAGPAKCEEHLAGSHTKLPGPQPGRNFSQVAKLACMQEQAGEIQCAHDPGGQGCAALQTRAALRASSKFLQILA